MHPLKMQRVDGIFLALEPVAGHVGKNDLHEAVFPGERLPVGYERRGLRPEIGPDEAAARFDGICGDADFLLKARVGLGNVFVGLLEAAAITIEKPAVIIAAQSALLDETVGHVRAAMRAVTADEAEGTAQLL